jgi:hypothetical protein
MHACVDACIWLLRSIPRGRRRIRRQSTLIPLVLCECSIYIFFSDRSRRVERCMCRSYTYTGYWSWLSVYACVNRTFRPTCVLLDLSGTRAGIPQHISPSLLVATNLYVSQLLELAIDIPRPLPSNGCTRLLENLNLKFLKCWDEVIINTSKHALALQQIIQLVTHSFGRLSR